MTLLQCISTPLSSSHLGCGRDHCDMQCMQRHSRKSLVKVRDAADGRRLELSSLDDYVGSQITNLSTPGVEKKIGEKMQAEKENGNLDSHP